MKNWKIFIIFMFYLYANNTFAKLKTIDKIAAIVNDDIILDSDINDMFTIFQQSVQKTNQQLPEKIILKQKILDQLIVENIILQLAKKSNITISDNQLDQAINNIATQNHMTLNQFFKYQNYKGANYKNLRSKIRKEMIVSKVCNLAVLPRIIIPQQEVNLVAQKIAIQDRDNTEFNINYILIFLPENPTQDQLNKAEKLSKFLFKKSKKTNCLVKAPDNNSYYSKVFKNGRMGWKKFKELPTLFASQLQNIKKGDIIGPIRSGIGFHILKVNDIRNDHQKLKSTEMHVRHILLRSSSNYTDKEIRIKLKYIAQKIKNGNMKFDTVAKKISEDRESAQKGGDLGWINADALDLHFRNRLMKLKKMEISTPVHSSFGWHLVQLLNTRQVDHTSTIRKNRARWLIFNKKFTEEVQDWMQEQRTSAYVYIL